MKVNRQKIEKWLKLGAQPSQTVSELIKKEKKLNS